MWKVRNSIRNAPVILIISFLPIDEVKMLAIERICYFVFVLTRKVRRQAAYTYKWLPLAKVSHCFLNNKQIGNFHRRTGTGIPCGKPAHRIQISAAKPADKTAGDAPTGHPPCNILSIRYSGIVFQHFP